MLNIQSAGSRPVPETIQAFALEDDTANVLSASADSLREVEEHPIRLMTALYDDVPKLPGGVLVKGTKPFMMFAMVHDFDQEPSFRESWVAQALSGVVDACEARQVRVLALEPLGCKYGGLSPSRFRTLLDDVLVQRSPRYLQLIQLLEVGR